MSATFTIVVGDERTSVRVQADPGTDPQHALALAIGCLQAEMADLHNCPVHRASTNGVPRLDLHPIYTAPTDGSGDSEANKEKG